MQAALRQGAPASVPTKDLPLLLSVCLSNNRSVANYRGQSHLLLFPPRFASGYASYPDFLVWTWGLTWAFVPAVVKNIVPPFPVRLDCLWMELTQKLYRPSTVKLTFCLCDEIDPYVQ
jgi:hypothetical protein